MPSIRTIPREKLYAVFKTNELVQLIEDILFQVGTAIPADTLSVQANLDAHIADPVAAHMATAIGNSPAGNISATTVQSAINELDAEKQPLDAALTALAALATVADRLIYATGSDAFALTTLTVFARSLLDDPDAGTALNTLGVASAVSTWLSSPTSANLRNALSDETGSGSAVFGTSPTLTTPEVNNPTGTMTLASGVLGYAAGNGGTVTQLTSKSTGVTLNKIAGEITLNNAALAAGAIVSFVLTDSAIAATDVIERNHVSGGTIGAYTIEASAAAGSATFYVRNNTAGSLGEALVIRFAVLKSANS